MSKLSTTNQVKITLPEQLYFYLKSKADKYGLTLSSYIKNLIIDDVKEMDIPTFKMSKKTEKVGLDAVKEHKAGKSIRIDSVSDFLEKL